MNKPIATIDIKPAVTTGGLPSSRKYESDGGPGIDSIMDVLAGSSHREEDRRCFFKAQLLFWRMRTGRCARSFAATGSRWASAMA